MTGISTARLLTTLAVLVVIALLVLGLVRLAGSPSSGESTPTLTLAQVRARLAGAPAPLAALHAQAGQILPGALTLVRARIAALRGYPLVIDKWASWCVPCREERGALQRASVSYGRTVAFLGVDSREESAADGRAFLRAVPVGYPSYYDPSGRLGEALVDSPFTPVTVFYDRAGHEYIHQGPYPSAAKLEADVRRYALDE